MNKIFVVCTGQEDNIGDVVLRRRLLNSLRPHGELHIYMGTASDSFLVALRLAPNDRVYSSKKQWRDLAYSEVRSRTVWLVMKPGELIADFHNLKAHARTYLLARRVKSKGGRVITLGIGQRQKSKLGALLIKPLLKLSDLLMWRDTESLESHKIGSMMPDWGFDETWYAPSSAFRSRLTVSYRADRPLMSENDIDSIKKFAQENKLIITVVTQVRRDEARTRLLASLLNGEAVTWPIDRDHYDQETILRRIYAETAIALSDRLHVLILAMAEGAAPLCLAPSTERKVARHFAAIGYEGVVHQIDLLDEVGIGAALKQALVSSSGVAKRLAEATEQIKKVDSSIAKLDH